MSSVSRKWRNSAKSLTNGKSNLIDSMRITCLLMLFLCKRHCKHLLISTIHYYISSIKLHFLKIFSAFDVRQACIQMRREREKKYEKSKNGCIDGTIVFILIFDLYCHARLLVVSFWILSSFLMQRNKVRIRGKRQLSQFVCKKRFVRQQG